MNDVRNFGAVGDGIADDTVAVQHAVEQGGGGLEFPPGKYRLTRPVVIDLEATGYSGIRGAQGASRILMEGAGPAFRLVGTHAGTASPPSIKENVWERQRFPVISGIEILGRHAEADGIELVRTMQTTIQNVLIRNCRHAIHLVERNRNFLLADSHIFDCLDSGVFFDRCNLHQVIISGNHISYCKRAGIRQLDGDVHNIQITGNDIEYNSGLEEISAEILLETEASQTSEYTISSNTIQATRESPGANIWIRGARETPALHTKLIAITGNVIGSRQHGVVIEDAARFTVTGNTIYDGIQRNVIFRRCQNFVLSSNFISTRPVRWDSTSIDGVTLEECSNGVVQGNVLNDCKDGSEQNGGTIVLAKCDAINVGGNQIGDPQSCGIRLVDSHQCLIQGNSIRSKAPLKDGLAIASDAASRDCLVQNNAVW
ncbi:MAG TPA: right-handed parallel beta-helix repeat-containing protein [Planctomycetaceae bacterium]|nr:right-handed parallel beta-helix repeat-containing protein [Planctomycetaceae bacterium]